VIHWALETWRPAHASGVDLLTHWERARLARLRTPQRRADWHLGRLIAKAVASRALAEVAPAGWPAAALEIANDARGVPFARLAPEAGALNGVAAGARLPVTLSVSHAGGYALCAATCSAEGGRGPGEALGIDLEPVEPRSDAFVDTFFTDDEQRLVRAAAPADRARCANLVWCAKEAVLKARGLGLTADTRDVRCLPEPAADGPRDWPLSPAIDGWRPFVARCAPAVIPGGGSIHGIWRSFPGFVGALARATA
jgi:phosphopantetheinyl transferase